MNSLPCPQQETPKPRSFPISLIIISALLILCLAATTLWLVLRGNDAIVDPPGTNTDRIGNVVNGGFMTQDDNWVYFIGGNTRTHQEFLLQMEKTTILNINVVGDWIYYTGLYPTENDGTSIEIGRMMIDGSRCESLYTQDTAFVMVVQRINLLDNRIYFYVEGYGSLELHHMNTDGSNHQQLGFEYEH